MSRRSSHHSDSPLNAPVDLPGNVPEEEVNIVKQGKYF